MPRTPDPDPHLPAVLKLYEQRGRDGLTTRAIAAELGIASKVRCTKLLHQALAHLGLPPPHPKSAAGSADEPILAVCRALITEKGLAEATYEAAFAAVEAAGLRCGWVRLRRLMPLARAQLAPKPGVGDGAERAPLESMRADGLITRAELAAAYGVTRWSILDAVERGDLTPAKREPSPHGGVTELFDPEKVTRLAEGYGVPVDIGFRGRRGRPRKPDVRRRGAIDQATPQG